MKKVSMRRLGAALALGLGLTALGASPAQAAPGDLPAQSENIVTFTPTSGNNFVIPTFSTDGPCPQASAAYYALMYGGNPGSQFRQDGQVIKDVGRFPENYKDEAFTFDASRTFQDTAADAGFTQLSGTYVIEVSCAEELGDVVKRFTTGNITFNTPTSYDAPPRQAPAEATQTTLSVSPPSPQDENASVTLTATIDKPEAAGDVQFRNNGGNFGAPVAVSNGSAALTTADLPVGDNSLSAVFTPSETRFTGSTSNTVPYTITAAAAEPTATSTSLSVDPPDTADENAPVTLTATVSPSNAVGAVQFKDGAATVGSPVAVSGGTASLTTSDLPVGERSLSAVFIPSDDDDFSASTSNNVPYTITSDQEPQPEPVIPEVPWAAALPLAGLGLLGAGIVMHRRRELANS